MKNIGQMLKQAQKMQSKVTEMQSALEAHEITGGSGAGMISVTLNGKGEMRSIKIDDSLITAGDTEMLEDLIVAAVNDTKSKVETYVAEEMQKVTAGLSLPPGMKLPI
ncbi:MAG: YbaB/EbfC family nucleoid-associated protein [Rhodospirillaceae bacterium]|nr:YbaB/EbfC family nucleoid-associated protein [Rhodospirillaceae bacterium]|tara:strand:+ start:86 stop:409 length:324 start_codon:yes stop_codon:yes gene_type:complete